MIKFKKFLRKWFLVPIFEIVAISGDVSRLEKHLVGKRVKPTNFISTLTIRENKFIKRILVLQDKISIDCFILKPGARLGFEQIKLKKVET